MTLPQKLRLKKKKDLEIIFKKGARFQNGLFLLKGLGNNLSFNRGAVMVPLSVFSKATARNKVRRVVSEALRNLLVSRGANDGRREKNGRDFIIVVQKGVAGKNFKEITGSLRDIFIKANRV